jgi:LuxR family transcriptional regulator, maltose regulon positive regulatory protein
MAFGGRTAISQSGVITRRRLLRFGRSASEPITLISAPAGYGKTTLLRQWVADVGPVVRLDPAEAPDSWQLWQQVSHALSLPAVTLILDDVHLLERDRSTDPLRDALRQANRTHRLVIATRSDPILALHEARLAGKVVELRAEDLAFDENETRLFLTANHIAVSDEQARALWVHTEGWPAGLRLSTTPLLQAAQSEDAFSTLLHGETAVGSYLMGQALSYTANDLREFLLKTSVSEFLDAELAEQLTGRTDSALLLEQAYSQPGFVHRHPEQRWPYRYHPMFRALLLAELMRSAPDDVRRLSGLAAEWFSQQGEHVRAVPVAVQGQSWNVLAESVLAGSCLALATGDWGWVSSAIARLPAAHRDANLSVGLASALIKLRTGGHREAIASALAILKNPSRASTRLEREVLEFLQAWQFAERGQVREAVRILELDPGDDSASASTPAAMGLQYAWRQLHAACVFVEGPLGALETRLDESGASRSQSYPNMHIGELEIRAWAAIVAGDLRSTRDHLHRASSLIDAESATWTPDQGGTLWSARQWLEMETGVELESRPDHLMTSHMRSAFPSPISRALEIITDARRRLIRDNDWLGCALLLDDVIATNPQVEKWWTTGYLWAIARTDAYLAAGEFSKALDLALQSSSGNGFDDGTRNRSYLWTWVLQRTALDSGIGQLSSELDRMMSDLPVESALLRGRSEALRVRVLLGAASLALRAGMPDHASHYLRLALHSTEVHEWRRPYSEIAAAIMPVLEAERRRITPYGERVVELLAYLRRQPISGARLTDPLSERELEILQYLPTPLDQRELCSALFISRNTLKTHLRSTYRKLGVQTRRQAVLEAERLGIL